MVRPGRTLRREFVRLLLLAVVLPVSLLAGLLTWRGAEATRGQFDARAAVAAEAAGRDVDRFLEAHLAAIQIVAERRGAADDIHDQAAWNSDLLRIHRHFPSFSAFSVLDRDGRALLSLPAAAAVAQPPSVPGRDVFRRPPRPASESAAYVFLSYSGAGPGIVVSAPLLVRGHAVGRVEGLIPVDAIAGLRSQSLRSLGYEVLILDRDRAVMLASSGLPYRPLQVLQEQGRDRPGRQLERLRVGATMQLLPGVLRDGGDAYARVVALRTGGTLYLLVPERVIQAQVSSDALALLGLLSLVLLGVLVIAAVQLRRLGGSVRNLLERMQTFALDRASPPMPPESMPRELAPLAEAMNQLSTRAHESFDAISLSLLEQSRLREELQAMAGRLLTVQEDERSALSRELHDDIGQSITAIKLGAGLLNDDDPARQAIVDEIVATADQTVAKLRNLSLLLRPPQLDTLGLEAALRGQIETLVRNARTRISLDVTPLRQRPPPALELACFRISQEALTNALRHSGATQISVRLDSHEQALELLVTDNGHGFDPAQARGLGLLTMRERAQQLGGTLTLESCAGGGTRVRATLPLDGMA